MCEIKEEIEDLNMKEAEMKKNGCYEIIGLITFLLSKDISKTKYNENRVKAKKKYKKKRAMKNKAKMISIKVEIKK